MPESNSKTNLERGEKGIDVSIASLYVEKLSAQRFQLSGGDLKYKNSVEPVSIKGKRFILRSTASMSFSGEAVPFTLDLQVCCRYVAEQEVTEEMVMQHLDELSSPLLNYSSHIISVITREMFGVPLILPPNAAEGKITLT